MADFLSFDFDSNDFDTGYDFDFPYHTVETENPESGFRGQFGNSYVFTSAPTAPDQRLFTLNFPMMKYFVDETGRVTDLVNPQLNMYALIKFYQNYKMHKSFVYNHVVHGNLLVKFYKPLKEPEVIAGGFGATKSFTIQLIEVP